MPNKTRKVKKGGATDHITMNDTWDIKIISSHGDIIDKKMYVVPPHTYILHLATAGKATAKLGWELDNWIYNFRDTTATRPGAMLHRFMTAINNGTFLKTSTNLKERVYTQNLKNEEQIYGGKSDATISYYEPGDIVFNMNLTMYNNTFPIFLQGLYSFPIPYKLKLAQFNLNKKVGAIDPTSDVNNLRATNLSFGKSILITPSDFAEAHAIFNVEENFLQKEMFVENKTKFSVHDILHNKLAPATAESPRLVIVIACRVSMDEKNAIRARRMSIATRRKPAPLEGKPDRFRPRLELEYMKRLQTAFHERKPKVKELEKMSDKMLLDNINVHLPKLISDLEAGKLVNRDILWDLLNDMTKVMAIVKKPLIPNNFQKVLDLKP
jgi:hypothetical protein